MKINQEWICCPICGNKTGIRVREDTVLENFPLCCPKGKLESLIEVKNKRKGHQRAGSLEAEPMEENQSISANEIAI